MAETKTVELDGRKVEVAVDNEGNAWANVVELSKFGRAIKPYCDRVRQHDQVRNDGTAHFTSNNVGQVLSELADSDVQLEAYESSVREIADHFITWSEPESE